MGRERGMDGNGRGGEREAVRRMGWGREVKGKERRRRVGSEDKELVRKGRRIEGKGKE